MNKQITALETLLALRENFIGPPTEADAADSDVPAPKPAKRKIDHDDRSDHRYLQMALGDPVDSDFHYCGELPLIGRPDCDMHDTQSYQAARKKKTAA